MMENINYIYTTPYMKFYENYIVEVGEYTSVTSNNNEHEFVTSYSTNIPFEYIETRS